MKFIQKALLGVGLLCTAHGHADEIAIYNSDFDASYLYDGSSYSKVNNWDIHYGALGVHNPTSDSFIGEEGDGVHTNTLYMVNSGKVSQTLGFKAVENTDYKLTFDVGQRAGIGLADYTVVIKAGSQVVLSSTNPVEPSESGTFARATVFGKSSSSSEELLTLEVSISGPGHVHFDNFELTYARDITPAKPFLKSVAYGQNLQVAGESTGACTTLHSLTSAVTNGPYMVALDDSCRCDDSHKVWVGSLHTEVSNGEYHDKNLYRCVISSEQ